MTKNTLIEIIKKLQKICNKQKIKIAFTGGIAVGIYGIPRTTYDVDGVILVERENLQDFLLILSKQGFKYDRKKPIKVIQNMEFITLIYSKYKMYVDLFLASGEFQRQILQSARSVKFNKIKINIISPENLILLKLQSGRQRDFEDVREIILRNKNKLDFVYLEKWAKKLYVDIYLKDELESLGLK